MFLDSDLALIITLDRFTLAKKNYQKIIIKKSRGLNLTNTKKKFNLHQFFHFRLSGLFLTRSLVPDPARHPHSIPSLFLVTIFTFYAFSGEIGVLLLFPRCYSLSWPLLHLPHCLLPFQTCCAHLQPVHFHDLFKLFIG